ncbi:amino acid transporter AVT1C [Tanacetum coccineum]
MPESYTGSASIAGYRKFGEKVDLIFVLSMPTEFYATQIAAHITVAHQLIRYIFGIYGVVQALEQEMKTDNGAFLTGHMPVIVRSVLVIVTIPLTLSIKFYGPTMALLGSVLGIMVAQIIPYFFLTTIRMKMKRMKTKGMNRFQIAGSHIIVILTVASLIAGMVGSIEDMINDK